MASIDINNVVDLYIRVSTSEQAEEGYSVAEQEERLRSYCAAYNYTINAVHVDPGFSGASLDRPAIKKVMYDVEAWSMQKGGCLETGPSLPLSEGHSDPVGGRIPCERL